MRDDLQQQMLMTFAGTTPQQISLTQLAQVLDATDKLVSACVRETFGIEIQAPIYLSEFRAGSIMLSFGVMPSAQVDPIAALFSVIRRVQLQQFEDMSPDLRRSLRRFFTTTPTARAVTFRNLPPDQARQDVRFRNLPPDQAGQQGVTLPTNIAIPFPDTPKPLEIEESTTLYGKLVSVTGGASPYCWLQTSRQNVRIDVTAEQARELGKYLDQEIGITGVATWNLDEMWIEKFVSKEIIPPRKYQSWEAALPHLQAFAVYYEDIGDSVAWVRSLRDDDDEEAE